jgi:spermidine/putrescine transport system substrate-binding protein
MKKKIMIYTLIVLAVFYASSKASLFKAADMTKTLRIYNSQDYIDDGKNDDGVKVNNAVYEDWALDYEARTGIKVNVVYETFETNETMLNALKIGKTTYDLVCTSEYAVQKMIEDKMLEKFNYADGIYQNIENYNLYGSAYLKELFENEGLSEYAIPYMWGTLGFLYDMDNVETEDVSHFSILWNTNYRKKGTAKDSMRDTYVAGVMYVYYDELMEYRTSYLAGELSSSEYNEKVTEIMNRVDNETIAKVKEALLVMKKNIYGFEVDNGKSDITTGRITINLAWSGDAVYAINSAEEDTNGKLRLGYVVPIEGSNIWSDDWVMPKGADVSLAEDFLNYLSTPEVAVRNMSYIGYTSSIAGDAVWETINDWYASSDGTPVDLSYFFAGSLSEEYLTDGKAIIYVDEEYLDRQFAAQYPTEEVVTRCAIMANFGSQNDFVIDMWKDVKSGSFNTTIIGIVLAVLIVSAVAWTNVLRHKKKNKHRLYYRKS